MFGVNHSNLGEAKTTYLYSHEYREPSKNKKPLDSQIVGEGDNARKSSVSSDSSVEDDVMVMGSDGKPHMVDISNMSQSEFKRLYENMRKGEPDNRVNF